MKSDRITLIKLAVKKINWLIEIVILVLYVALGAVIYYFKEESTIIWITGYLIALRVALAVGFSYYKQWKALKEWKSSQN